MLVEGATKNVMTCSSNPKNHDQLEGKLKIEAEYIREIEGRYNKGSIITNQMKEYVHFRLKQLVVSCVHFKFWFFHFF